MRVSATLVSYSSSRAKRRFFMTQAKDRSTTHRRGSTSKPLAVALRRTICRTMCVLSLRPFDEATRVAAIGVGAFHEWVPLARALQDALAAVAVLDVGAMNLHREQPTICVGQDVALAAADLLASVEALRAPL